MEHMEPTARHRALSRGSRAALTTTAGQPPGYDSPKTKDNKQPETKNYLEQSFEQQPAENDMSHDAVINMKGGICMLGAPPGIHPGNSQEDRLPGFDGTTDFTRWNTMFRAWVLTAVPPLDNVLARTAAMTTPVVMDDILATAEGNEALSDFYSYWNRRLWYRLHNMTQRKPQSLVYNIGLEQSGFEALRQLHRRYER